MPNPVRVLRESLGISQAELGEQLGVTRGRIHQVELGQGNLHSKKLLVLQQLHGREMKRLGISLEDLLSGRTSAESRPSA